MIRQQHFHCFVNIFNCYFSNTTVTSVNEPVATGTRCAPPSNLPSISGITLPIALAAPVELGTMFCAAARARRLSPFCVDHLESFGRQCKRE